MRFQQLALSLAALATPILGQTPQGSPVTTNNLLPVKYGSTVVTPGIMLPETRKSLLHLLSVHINAYVHSVTTSYPTISYPAATANTNYMVLLVDFSIPGRSINASFPGAKAPGIGAGRYTRLHYWQTDITFGANGTFVNKTAPIAAYQGPAPPQGDIPHIYAFFLFPQTSAFVPPAPGTQFSAGTVDQGMNRLNFDILALSKQAGVGPIAAGNYIMVQNSTMTATGTAATGTRAATASSTAKFTGAATKIDGSVMSWGVGAGALLAWLL